MEYMSKTEFRNMLEQQFARIQDFNWCDPILLSHWGEQIPNKPGIMILKNKDNIIINISASNDLARRLDELLNKSEGKFDEATQVQFTLEYEQILRFGKKADLKNLLKMAEIGEERMFNVLDDDDPRIIQQFNDRAEYVAELKRS